MSGCWWGRKSKAEGTSSAIVVGEDGKDNQALASVPATTVKPQAKPQAAQQTAQITGKDLQFLPAALEILETPTAPATVAFMLTICTFAAAAIAWSFIGHLDINAVAAGKIEALGHTKVIEVIDPGKVLAVHVAPGAEVHEGDLLLEFDPAETKADHEAASNVLISSLAEVARRGAAVNSISALRSASGVPQPNSGSNLAIQLSRLSTEPPAIDWDRLVSQAARDREIAVLKADLSQLAATLASLETQLQAKQATIERLKSAIAQDQSIIETVKSLVNVRQEAFSKGFGNKIGLLDVQVEFKKALGQLEGDKGQLKEAQASLTEIESENLKTLGQFVADNQNKLADAMKRSDDAKQAVNKADAKLNHTKLYAPVDGIVQKLAVTTIGQVFTTGQQIMVLAPAKPTLQVEALVPNTDIGFLKVGQQVVIKVDAFPFTRFGTVSGHITRIAPEAIEEQDAKRQMATAKSSANEAASASGGTPGQVPNFVFPITIALDKSSIPVDGVEVPLSSGMTVMAEVRTGKRRIIDYLLSPLSKITNEAFKER